METPQIPTTEKWTARFLDLAKHIAGWSEDQSTQVGAVISGPGHEILSTGVNGFPRGVSNVPERNERPTKYEYFEHAERSAIYNLVRSQTQLCPDSVLWVWASRAIPICCDCVRGIIQSGIRHVVLATAEPLSMDVVDRWTSDDKILIAESMMEEAGVNYHYYGKYQGCRRIRISLKQAN